jgi:hypothetical protein
MFPLDEVWVDGRVELLGYDLPLSSVEQGGVLSLTLYARVPETQTHILMPFGVLGEIEQRWTTDSRRLTPDWQPGEIIAERYEVFVPYSMSPGRYPLFLGYADLTAGRHHLGFSIGDDRLLLGNIRVAAHPRAARESQVIVDALTNLGNDVALVSSLTQSGWAARVDAWEKPLRARPGDVVHLTLQWEALARPRMSYTVFLHLLDESGRLRWGHDYTPLGGAFPSYLWFPKWLEGQRVYDPYRLELPQDLPPGRYWLEVGMYEMGSVRRIPQLGPDGTMIGDRYILGSLEVVQPQGGKLITE